MRGAVLALSICVALTGCKREPTFEERYDKAEQDIRETAREIDRELADPAGAPAEGTRASDKARPAPPETRKRT
ncbi:hypothetical protein [Pelagerythrobacter sp.]|uniref:hypothetical protein n=1 Tax=Pelagerythrobacter sp. TaxID=2800702 RepID=UPI0035AF90DF